MSLRPFPVLETVSKPCRTRPGKTRLYTLLECAYCHSNVDVPTSSFETALARRIHEHLENCPEYHWDLPPLRRSRAHECTKPCGREYRALVQMHLGKHGLERHELGSLLKCLASKRVALDSKAMPVSRADHPHEWMI